MERRRDIDIAERCSRFLYGAAWCDRVIRALNHTACEHSSFNDKITTITVEND